MRDVILGLVNPLIALIFAGIFFALWWRDRSRVELRAFMLAYALLATGFLWSQFAPTHPTRIFVSLTHLPYFAGTTALVWGIAHRLGKAVPLKAFAAIFTVSTGLLLLAKFMPGDVVNAELYVSNTAYGILFMTCAMLVAPARRRSGFEMLVFWMVVLTAAQFFIRPSVSFMLEGELVHTTYRQSAYYSLLNATVALLSLGLAMSLIAASVHDQWEAGRERLEHDVLTGLLARRAFEARAAQMIERSRAEGLPLSLVIGDIDHFKQVNDIWGHGVGDRAIAAFGEVIDRTKRDCDVAGRIGGEEFCVLVWNADEAIAVRLAERLRVRLIDTEVHGLTNDTRLSASFGAGELAHGESWRDLFDRTDRALYAAKDAGRNRVVCASETAERRSLADREPDRQAA